MEKQIYLALYGTIIIHKSHNTEKGKNVPDLRKYTLNVYFCSRFIIVISLKYKNVCFFFNIKIEIRGSNSISLITLVTNFYNYVLL